MSWSANGTVATTSACVASSLRCSASRLATTRKLRKLSPTSPSTRASCAGVADASGDAAATSLGQRRASRRQALGRPPGAAVEELAGQHLVEHHRAEVELPLGRARR